MRTKADVRRPLQIYGFRHSHESKPVASAVPLPGVSGGRPGRGDAVKALLVTNEFLEAQIAELRAAVSNGYARGKFESLPRDRKDWYD
jgi:hypothetical protein